MTAQDLASARTVKQWFASARLESEPAEDLQTRLDLLGGFLAHVGKDADELVEYCFLRKKDTGERFSSVKRRGEVNDWIEQYVAAREWTGKDAVMNGNTLRSFMIHNGAVIQGSAWRG
ncbi:MAG: hypothetical protein ACT4QF_22065 [Sporichthyaceae bacterium]